MPHHATNPKGGPRQSRAHTAPGACVLIAVAVTEVCNRLGNQIPQYWHNLCIYCQKSKLSGFLAGTVL